MKKILVIVFGFVFISTVSACEVMMTADKESYAVGDTAVVTLILTQTHKNCVNDAVEPVMRVSGCELTAKTKYKRKAPGVYEIKYKFKITSSGAKVNAKVECDKEGGNGSLQFKVK